MLVDGFFKAVGAVVSGEGSGDDDPLVLGEVAVCFVSVEEGGGEGGSGAGAVVCGPGDGEYFAACTAGLEVFSGDGEVAGDGLGKVLGRRVSEGAVGAVPARVVVA